MAVTWPYLVSHLAFCRRVHPSALLVPRCGGWSITARYQNPFSFYLTSCHVSCVLILSNQIQLIISMRFASIKPKTACVFLLSPHTPFHTSIFRGYTDWYFVEIASIFTITKFDRILETKYQILHLRNTCLKRIFHNEGDLCPGTFFAGDNQSVIPRTLRGFVGVVARRYRRHAGQFAEGKHLPLLNWSLALFDSVYNGYAI